MLLLKLGLPSALWQASMQFYLSNIGTWKLFSFTMSPFPPPNPPYSAREPHQLTQHPGLTSKAQALLFPNLQLNMGEEGCHLAPFLLTLLLLCNLFNKPPATLDVRNKEMTDNLFIPADQLETRTQPNTVISKMHFLVFCRVWSPFQFVFAQVFYWIYVGTPNEQSPEHIQGTFTEIRACRFPWYLLPWYLLPWYLRAHICLCACVSVI